MKLKNFNKKTHPEILDDAAKGIGMASGLSALAEQRLACSGHVVALLTGISWDEDAELLESNIAVSARVTWAAVQWVRSGRPILKITPELRNMLLNTLPPEEPLEVLPNIPFDGFYLVVDGFELFDNKTGLHKVEGIYVCKDQMRMSHESSLPVDGLMITAVGEDKGGIKPGLMRDDTLHYFGIIPGGDLNFWKDALVGMKETLQVVLNLLLLWNTEASPITMKTVVPPAIKSPGKKKKLARRGYSNVKYITLGVKTGYLDQKIVSEVKNWDGPTHLAMVRGFFRKYWVTDPTDAQILDKKLSEKGTQLFCIRRFVAPHRAMRRGEAPTPNIYEVKS